MKAFARFRSWVRSLRVHRRAPKNDMFMVLGRAVYSQGRELSLNPKRQVVGLYGVSWRRGDSGFVFVGLQLIRKDGDEE